MHIKIAQIADNSQKNRKFARENSCEERVAAKKIRDFFFLWISKSISYCFIAANAPIGAVPLKE